MSNVFFTADTHFHHSNALQAFRKGLFDSVDAMDEHLISAWNDKVKKPSDRVYHLGDVGLGRPEFLLTILSKLNGQIYLIRGNHDRTAEHNLCKNRFVWIKDYFNLKIGEQKICLSHYAFRTWECKKYGSWHLHGHSHGNLPELPGELSFDVGVDCWDFAPVSYDEVRAKMQAKRDAYPIF